MNKPLLPKLVCAATFAAVLVLPTLASAQTPAPPSLPSGVRPPPGPVTGGVPSSSALVDNFAKSGLIGKWKLSFPKIYEDISLEITGAKSTTYKEGKGAALHGAIKPLPDGQYEISWPNKKYVRLSLASGTLNVNIYDTKVMFEKGAPATLAGTGTLISAGPGSGLGTTGGLK